MCNVPVILDFINTLVTLAVFDSVEFYVIAAVIAAAIVAFTARGGDRGPVRQFLLPGVLTLSATRRDKPSIELICCDDGAVVLRRHGVEGITLSGAVSLAVEVNGFDVRIIERTVPGRPGDTEIIDTADFILEFMGAERYFINYTAEDAALFVAVTLHNRPGIRVEKTMQ